MPYSDSTVLGVANRFQVVVQGVDLGGWATCKGLVVDFRNDVIREGGRYDSVTIIPERVLYTPITLTRAMNPADSRAVQSWLQKVVQQWYADSSDGSYSDHTAAITLRDSKNAAPVMTWSLRNVYPLKWRGPDLDAAAGAVAIETLELAHEGFL